MVFSPELAFLRETVSTQRHHWGEEGGVGACVEVMRWIGRTAKEHEYKRYHRVRVPVFTDDLRSSLVFLCDGNPWPVG